MVCCSTDSELAFCLSPVGRRDSGMLGATETDLKGLGTEAAETDLIGLGAELLTVCTVRIPMSTALQMSSRALITAVTSSLDPRARRCRERQAVDKFRFSPEPRDVGGKGRGGVNGMALQSTGG